MKDPYFWTMTEYKFDIVTLFVSLQKQNEFKNISNISL